LANGILRCCSMQRLVLLASSCHRPIAPLLNSALRALQAHASNLSLASVSVEVGCNNSPEELNQGFDIAAVVSFGPGAAAGQQSAASFTQQFEDSLSQESSLGHPPPKTKALSLLFSATPSPHCAVHSPATQHSIRHFVAWRFRPDAAPHAVDAAVAGYLNLPQLLPYFSHLEVGAETSLVPSYSVCLYSTFHDAAAQDAFVNDTRRIAFKDTLVKPHLASNGVLVFDFVPSRG
jgi:hypothetical protein